MPAGAIQENTDGLRSILWFLVVMAIGVLAFNVYYYCYGFFSPLIGNEYLDGLVVFLSDRVGMFRSPWYSVGLAYFLLVVYAWFSGANLTVEDKVKFLFLDVDVTKKNGVSFFLAGSLVFLASPVWLYVPVTSDTMRLTVYLLLLISGMLFLIFGAKLIHRIVDAMEDNDYFNDIQRSAFPQCEELIENKYSVNIPTIYRFGKAERHGWINIINPFRATSVMGTPGSGKSFAFINEFIRQHLKKGFTMYVYDYKFPTLSKLVYNNYLKNRNNKTLYPVRPAFRVVNFDDPRYSHRVNPLKASTLTDISDAYESAYTTMVTLNKSWADKQGEFFQESAINFMTAVIWYLKLADGGKYCTMPHVIEFATRSSADIILIMATYAEIWSYVGTFYETLKRGVLEQLQGQVSSMQIVIGRLKSIDMYWVLSGDDFPNGLNINDPKNPVVLCLGNNPDRQQFYGALLSLVNGRLIKNVNKQGRLPLSLIIDELPTIFFKGLDTLIATARSNKVSTCIGYQDNTQLIANFGENEAKKIIRTVGNTISGQVNRDAAQELQEMFGKNKQHKRSINTSSEGNVSINIDEQEDFMIPASRIAQLSQGQFVGLTADDAAQRNQYPVFYAKTNLDIEAIKAEEDSFVDMPQIYAFNDIKQMDRLYSLLTSEKVSKLSSNASEIAERYAPMMRLFADNMKEGGKWDVPEVELKLNSLEKELRNGDKHCKLLLDAVQKVRRMTIDERMKKNADRIGREVDELIARELHKIETDPRYESIRETMEKLNKGK